MQQPSNFLPPGIPHPSRWIYPFPVNYCQKDQTGPCAVSTCNSLKPCFLRSIPPLSTQISKYTKSKVLWPKNSSNGLLGITENTTKMHTYVDQKMTTIMFIVVLLIRVKKWKHLHNINSGMDKLWYIHKVEYSIAMKISELFQVTTWINLTMLKEGSHTQKYTLCSQVI